MTFKLQIAAPDGLRFDGEAEKMVTRTMGGDAGILPRHSDYVAALGVGKTLVWPKGGDVRAASSEGGMISVIGGVVRIAAFSFEWDKG